MFKRQPLLKILRPRIRILAGVLTGLSIFSTKDPVPKNTTADIYGLLWRADTFENLPNKLIRLYRSDPLQYHFFFYDAVYTDADGFYRFSDVVFNMEGTWELYATFEGDTEFEACQSSTITVECTVIPGVYTLTLQSDKIEGQVGDEFNFFGQLTKDATGVHTPYDVDLYVNGTYLMSTPADPEGRYEMLWKAEEGGTYTFVSKTRADEEEVVSPGVVITITAPPPPPPPPDECPFRLPILCFFWEKWRGLR